MIPSKLFRALGEGRNQWSGPHPGSALVPSSCQSHLLMNHREPNAQAVFLGMKINTLVKEFILLPGLGNMGISNASHGFIASCLPNLHTTVFLCFCEIQRERSYFLNFSFHYVNICEQINCECGFHPFPCLGPHISFPTH